MLNNDIIGIITILCLICSYAPYLKSIFQNETKPHLFSWIIWSLLMGIGFAIQVHELAGPGAWVTGCACLVCAFIAILSVYKGEKTIAKSDWFSFVGALSALPLWYVTKDPFWSVILITFIDGVGFFPTIRKSYHKPFEENPLLYSFGSLGAFLSLFAMTSFNFNTVFCPATMAIMQAGFVVFLMMRRHAILKVSPRTTGLSNML